MLYYWFGLFFFSFFNICSFCFELHLLKIPNAWLHHLLFPVAKLVIPSLLLQQLMETQHCNGLVPLKCQNLVSVGLTSPSASSVAMLLVLGSHASLFSVYKLKCHYDILLLLWQCWVTAAVKNKRKRLYQWIAMMIWWKACILIILTCQLFLFGSSLASCYIA